MTERRRRVLRAAMELASAGGYEGVTMRAVASRSGVGIATVYRHFPSKDVLLASALGEWVDRLGSGVTTVDGSGAPVERLVALLRGACDAIERRPRLAAAGFAAMSSADPGVVDVGATVSDRLREVMAAALDGVPASVRADAAAAVRHVWSSSVLGWANGRHDLDAVRASLVRAAHLVLDDWPPPCDARAGDARAGDARARADETGRTPAEDASSTASRIVDAALALVAERGADVNVRDVAARAGVAPATLYRHFTSKDELLALSARAWVESLRGRVVVVPDPGEPVETALARTLRGACAALEREPLRTGALVGALSSRDRSVARAAAEVGEVVASMVTPFLDDLPPDRAVAVVELVRHVWWSSLSAWANGRGALGDVADELDRAARLVLGAQHVIAGR